MTPEAFQQIMLERKEERKRHAKMKQQEGLRLIAEMNSEDPGSLFPAEIWELIFETMYPRELYIMYQLHPFYRNIIMKAPNIKNFLLPPALDYNIPLLKMLLNDYSNHRDREDKAKILTLRRLSKGVKEAVDCWIQDDLLNCTSLSTRPRFHPISFAFTDNAAVLNRISAFTRGPIAQEKPKQLVFRAIQINFSSRVIVPRFYRYDKDTGDFVLEYSQRYEQTLTEFKTRITEFLGKVGAQILYFGLSGFEDLLPDASEPDFQSAYDLLREWLILLPNVKWIDMRTNEPCIEVDTVNLPMPKLNALERVEFDVEIFPTLEAILSANPQVKHAAHKFRFGDYCFPYCSSAITPLALESMTMGDPRFYTAYANVDIQEFQLLFSNTNWKNLKRLRLCVKTTALHEVFEALQDNFPALEMLSFHVYNVTIEKELGYLRLPNLKYLELKFGENVMVFNGDFRFFFSIHFLLHCCNLQSLKWTNLFPSDFDSKWQSTSAGEKLIDFPGSGSDWNWNARNSNIWNVFRQLRFIKLRFRRECGPQRTNFERSFVRPLVTG